ncbi:MAG: hypothetical protein KAJ53_04245, partial [Anaerolineales bacterium]|nr:hypothetical protein [Anaerolineales bacterium]
VREFWRTYRKEVVDWRAWFYALRLTILASLIPVPFIFYNVVLFSTDEFLKAWTTQNVISSPHPLHYLLAYGLCLPFMLTGSVRLLRYQPWTGLLPVVWVLALPFFAYAPINIQRRLPEGIWVAIVVLTMFAFDRLKEDEGQSSVLLANPGNPSRFRFLLYFAFPSTLLILVGGLLSTIQRNQPIFRAGEEVASFSFLERNVNSSDIVLSSYNTGNALPAWAPVRVVIGHGPESIGLQKLLTEVQDFYTQSTSDSQREQFLSKLAIQYVYWGPAERKLGDWDPHQATYLSKIYDNDGYGIFEVISINRFNE